MCKDCGCEEALEGHGRSHGHSHRHGDHEHSHPHGHGHHDDDARTVEVGRKVLERNDLIAAENREFLESRGVVALNLISSPGSGKTALLERTLDSLKGVLDCSVIVGDQCTDNDARRLSGRGAKVAQIETRSSCHLSAAQIKERLPELIGKGSKLLFIENVGNLVCPAAFDLGEAFKVALLSTAEGEDKPLKYPVLFTEAKAALITKIDLAPHLDWSASECRRNLRKLNPGVFVFELSARSGEGFHLWLDYLKSLVS